LTLISAGDLCRYFTRYLVFDPPGSFGVQYDKIPTLQANIEIDLHAIDGSLFNVTIHSSELGVEQFKTNASICLTLVDADDTHPVDVMGGVS
jgi:hypothetical protein